MPKHLCIDPHDPYAQDEVMVEFERIGSGFRLVAVIDDRHDDILDDLVEAQCDDLRRELADADRTPSALIVTRIDPRAVPPWRSR